MPPRSVCLNVFTTTLGETSSTIREDGGISFGNTNMTGPLERRDSALSDDIARRSSSGSISPAQTPVSGPASPVAHRAELFQTLRPMASTESMNISLTSKPCTTCSTSPARRRCSRCKEAYYCDRACQKNDWKTHRAMCSSTTTPPNSEFSFQRASSYSLSAPSSAGPATPNYARAASPGAET